MKHICLILLTLFLVSCSDLSAIFDEPVTLSFQVEEVKEIENDQKVLLARFNEFPQLLFASAETHITNNVIEFVIHGGSPPKELIRDVILVPGNVLFKSEKGEVIVSSQNVADASSGYSDGQFVVYVSLNEEGGNLMRSWSSRNVGKIMLVEYDGEDIAGARIAEPLGKRFMISADFEPEFSTRLALHLRTGPLLSRVNWIE